MTITLHWWTIPIVLFVAAWVGFFIIASLAGDYDVFTPLIALAFLSLFIGGAIFFTLGHLF